MSPTMKNWIGAIRIKGAGTLQTQSNGEPTRIRYDDNFDAVKRKYATLWTRLVCLLQTSVSPKETNGGNRDQGEYSNAIVAEPRRLEERISFPFCNISTRLSNLAVLP